MTILFDDTKVDSIGVKQEEESSTYDCGKPAKNNMPTQTTIMTGYFVERVKLDDVRKCFGEVALCRTTGNAETNRGNATERR